eukprot:TRINITY_DN17520_c0_g1_i1.p1 TRINITY_DN17520_c0_g1~~TRINITY_DN17520_c0_g1_i1.p1  ORF type:complete len:186 (+),score=67.09 TRINITY_DN17520_c0_g1_i1:195-752(+)
MGKEKKEKKDRKDRKDKKHKKKDKKQDKKKGKSHKSDKKHKKDSKPVQLSKFFDPHSGSSSSSCSSSSSEVLRSSISGKRIKRKRSATAEDTAEQAHRAALLASLNEGDEHRVAAPKQSKETYLQQQWKECLADPSKMVAMMNQAAANKKAKRSRLSALVRGNTCLLYTSPSPRDRTRSRMPSSA